MNKCAFDLDDKCAALTNKECKGCHFFKTQQELEEGRKKANERLGRLDRILRENLINEYYGGKSPFNV